MANQEIEFNHDCWSIIHALGGVAWEIVGWALSKSGCGQLYDCKRCPIYKLNEK